MKIVAPISRLSEIETLAWAGANELYCGVLPRNWVGTFKAANANRRPGGNLSDLEELASAVNIAHANDCTLSLVLNAQHYSGDQVDAATDIARTFVDCGGDTLIVSDIGLIHALAGSPERTHGKCPDDAALLQTFRGHSLNRIAADRLRIGASGYVLRTEHDA